MDKISFYRQHNSSSTPGITSKATKAKGVAITISSKIISAIIRIKEVIIKITAKLTEDNRITTEVISKAMATRHRSIKPNKHLKHQTARTKKRWTLNSNARMLRTLCPWPFHSITITLWAVISVRSISQSPL